MHESDEILARQIEAIGSLPYETALRALQAGGRPRELALSILEANEKYQRDREELSEARKKLREAVLA